MRNGHYKYNSELVKPAGSINCNRNNPLIALREKRSIKQHQKSVENYMPPEGIVRKLGCFQSVDGENIPFYQIERCEAAGHPVPCIVYFHGGGFMMPLQVMMLQNAAYYAAQTGYKMFLPEYRYAPNVSCKITLEDCFYMVLHLIRNAQDFSIDPGRIIIYGDSAGGALAAGVAHLMRDRGLPAAAGQMLIYPATDYRSERYESIEEYQYAVWPKKSNLFMWSYFLKNVDPSILPYAAPMNMNNFGELPPPMWNPRRWTSCGMKGLHTQKNLSRQEVQSN